MCVAVSPSLREESLVRSLCHLTLICVDVVGVSFPSCSPTGEVALTCVSEYDLWLGRPWVLSVLGERRGHVCVRVVTQGMHPGPTWCTRQALAVLEKPRGNETAGDAGFVSQQPLGAVLGAGLHSRPREVGALHGRWAPSQKSSHVFILRSEAEPSLGLTRGRQLLPSEVLPAPGPGTAVCSGPCRLCTFSRLRLWPAFILFTLSGLPALVVFWSSSGADRSLGWFRLVVESITRGHTCLTAVVSKQSRA